MALFQNAVLNKYLSGVDEKKIEEAWEKFTAHFHNAEIQENIRNSKEEAYQEGFLDDLFVKVLGYTKNPAPGYNLVVEQKNITDSKKSDGALLDGDKVRGVIELKGTETTDLGKVETQAFGYKNNQPNATYVIISNFEKLRFYIDNTVDFLEFNLFQLTKEEFNVLWLCLGYSNFAKGLPKKIKDASLTEEENVTKELYNDYSDFKHAVFESMKEHNPEYDKLLLFKKTQKLLDRFLFILFAEDRLLLPPNSIREIINQWMDLRDKYDEYVPLYDRFKKYFGYMNEGHKGENYEIFAYNGGLFAEDEVLDNLNIEDEILYKYTQELSNYDFESEVDVNILGHIFEHSLNEVEEINAELKGEKVDSSKTRRKKDGVFYTPKYITKYIVEHTVGTLCEEKKAELEIVDERFTEAGRRSKKGVADLKKYREWLLDLTICDPACGSGAFLNQALEFLIGEHKYIDELQAKYHGEALVLSDIEDQILENNLFGVDINEESVEIAKLSLWLRTAQKGRKLTSLNNHIKCGNSLIDDPEVAGDKAFKWEEEFPGVFRQKEKQAFHVTFVTHNSRTSQRMKEYKVKKGDSFRLDDELEVFVTRAIAEIVKKDDLNVPAYNICADHVHMILVCEPEELPNIVRKLKGKSAQKLKEHLEVPKEEKFHLWAQKFNRKLIEDDEALANVQEYIKHNRKKHELPPPDKGLQPLVKDMCCSYDYAFRPEYTGGFDVVIGNPPYVSSKGENFTDELKEYFIENYSTSVYQIDLYILFLEKSVELINKSGLTSFIVPNAWLNNLHLEDVRNFFLKNVRINEIVTMPSDTFEQANVDTIITSFSKTPLKGHKTKLSKCDEGRFFRIGSSIQSEWEENDLSIINPHLTTEVKQVLDKTKKNSVTLESFTEIGRGVGVYHKRVGHTKEFIASDPYQSDEKEDETFVPYLRGKNVTHWYINWKNDSYISYGDWLAEPRHLKFFEGERIVLRQIPAKKLVATYLEKKFITDQSVFIASFTKETDFKPKPVLAVMTSSLMSFYFRFFYSEFDDLFPKVKLKHFKSLPISKSLIDYNSELNDLADERLNRTEELYNLIESLCDLLQSKFDIEKLSRKLQSWHELTFKQFLKELKKKKVKLSLEEEAEWMEYFKEQKAGAGELKAQIAQTDAEIDAMVYELYGLTEEEIEVVEGS